MILRSFNWVTKEPYTANVDSVYLQFIMVQLSSCRDLIFLILDIKSLIYNM